MSNNSENSHSTHSPGLVEPKSYAECFQKLGFKLDTASENKREEFLRALRSHVDGSDHKFLRSADNESAFRTVVFEFFIEYGAIFWGKRDRGHLEETQVSTGFSYPRDTYLPESRFVARLLSLIILQS